MSDETETYYRVPVGVEKTISGDKREMTVWSHLFMTLIGVAVAATAVTVGPQPLAYVGLFLSGWAANNTLIAWRCDRVDESSEVTA